MAVQEHAPVDILTFAGNRVFPHGHCVLFKSLPEPQTVYLADWSFPVADGVPDGCIRDYSPLGLEILLVFCNMDGLHRNLDDWRGVHQGYGA